MTSRQETSSDESISQSTVKVKHTVQMSAEEKAKKSAVIVKTGEQVTISNIVEKTDSGIIAELTNGKKVYISTGAGKTQMLIPLQALILSVLTMMIFVTVLLVIKFS